MFRRRRAVPIALIAVAALTAFLLGAIVASASASAAEPKASLAKVAFGSRALKQGMSGTDVRVMQKWLTLLGIDTDVDGSFGPATKKSVMAWEKKGGLPANGVMTVDEAKKLRTEIDNSPEAQRNADDPKPKPKPDDDEAPPTTGQTPPGDEAGFTFPVQGKFSWGTSENRFGASRGGRSHQGHDIMADCGLIVKAVEPGKVVYAGFQGAAGNYIVIRGQGTKRDYVYMHLRSPAKFDTDDTVPAKATIGVVGQTGSASACHLHFELWTPPGWYDGGKAIDPLPYLKQWAAAAKR
jgi:murein DD-endopeptidase MepM/ murein hydrolase activator NlpD